MKTLDDFDFEGKVVLVRSDLNSDVRASRVGSRKLEVGRVIESERIGASVETLRELKKKGARVVVLAHQGRKGKSDFVSLKSHARFLNKYVKVKFVEDVCGARAISEIGNMKNGEAVLLENVRFVGDEFKPEKGRGNELYKLVEVADFFVNDAFSVCHRSQASVVLFPKYLPSFAGRLLEAEVKALRQVVGGRGRVVGKDVLYVLGGAKPSDNLKLLGKGGVLACGLFGQMCLIASGKKLGAQEDYLRKVVGDYDGVLGKLRGIIKPQISQMNADDTCGNGKLRLKGGGRIFVPVDFAVKVGGRRVERGLGEFPCGDEIFDIGSKTIANYVKEIGKARCVFVKGPAGDAGDVKFSKGTVALLKAVAKCKFSLVGGGHLSDAIKKYKLSGFGHVSLSGGALVAYLAGEKPPGLEALNRGVRN